MAGIVPESDPTLIERGLALLGVGVWSYDVWGDRFRCDERTARLFGLSSEDRQHGVPIARVGEAIHPEDRERYWARRRFTQRFGGNFSMEYRTVPGFRVMARGCYNADETGTLVEARGIVIDLTGRDSDRDAQVLEDSMVAGLVTGPALEKAALHVVAAHRAIRDSAGPEGQLLRPAADALLAEMLRVIVLATPGPLVSH